jgi:hypothetical protein
MLTDDACRSFLLLIKPENPFKKKCHGSFLLPTPCRRLLPTRTSTLQAPSLPGACKHDIQPKHFKGGGCSHCQVHPSSPPSPKNFSARSARLTKPTARDARRPHTAPIPPAHTPHVATQPARRARPAAPGHKATRPQSAAPVVARGRTGENKPSKQQPRKHPVAPKYRLSTTSKHRQTSTRPK